ncbi:restriction endonuclease subunit S [Novosphingobium resinovorum]|uniref:restriction endonuclease subunit S n=1 Tax=Novosphingobium resinovorum TaxID=158500 RepID=UPI002ED15CFB|nr:restriction endonuclease subunit S [Novosphingobium resinovorum]
MSLPDGWVAVPLDELTSKIGSGATPRGGREAYGGGEIPLIRSMNVHFAGFDPEGLAFLSQAQADGLANVVVEESDVLLNITGASIGRVCLAPPSMAGARVNQHVCIIRLREVLARYVQSYLASPSMQQFILSENYGLTRQALTKGMIETIGVPLPPLPEQRRIVAKLDALTAHLARARAELDRVPVLAEHLRQSSVVAAFKGELSAAWRNENADVAKTSPVDLDAAYEAVAGQKRRKAAAAIDWQPDVKLPPHWRWVSVDEVLGVVQYGSSAKTSDASDGVPVLRMGNIQRGELDWGNLKYLPAEHAEFPNLFLEPGDVLFNRTNSFELVGKSAVFRGHEAPASYASYLIRLRCSGILPGLLVFYLNSPFGRAWVGQVASQQVGQANVNGTKLKGLGIPLPPEDEQQEMVRILTDAFARADRMEAEAARARALIDRLEAALLAKAFRGELVPQDPADEPASALLARLRTQRAAAPKAKRGRRPKEAAA